MGAKYTVADGEKKPFVKHEGRLNNHYSRGYNKSCRENTPRKEQFLGADPDLCGHMYETKHNRSEQVVNFTTVDDIIKAQVGTECNPFILESIEKEVKSLFEEPTAVTKEGGSMTKIEEMTRCHGDTLLFTQPDVNSLMGQSNTSSKTVGISRTWILLDSQSTIDVFCNGELIT